jgi:hypothetical protein
VRARASGRRLYRALATGLGRAAARPALIGAIWAWHLVLGLALAVPFFQWLQEATAYRPTADVLAQRFSFGLLAELQQYDSVSVLAILSAGVLGGLLVATLASPLFAAATLASLRDAALRARDLGDRAVSCYWPFLRVILFGRLAAVAGAMTVAAALRPVLWPLSQSSWEGGWLLAIGIRVAAAALVAVLMLAAVDFALVRLDEQQSRNGLRAWVAGLRFAGSHLPLTLGLWTGAALLLTAAVAVFVGLREVTTSAFASLPTVLVVGIAVVLQQLFMVTRTWLRLGLLGAEQHAFGQADALVPVADAAPERELPAAGAAAIETPPGA